MCFTDSSWKASRNPTNKEGVSPFVTEDTPSENVLYGPFPNAVFVAGVGNSAVTDALNAQT